MVKICIDEYPKDSNYENYFNEFNFELSNFQKYAIESIVEGQHCLVTAHTGSGKTLPAEFAIKYMTKNKKKIIYTSPIKALSNQKFYDFKNKYPDLSIGLFTGDIKTNPEAEVLIMTTEILMNYLFNLKENKSIIKNLDFNIDIENELGCVVFDEVHYINDPDRGETWEKTILMLPEEIQMIMLSATIESPLKFAEWCERGKKKEVYLCSTDHRVVPLGHYSYITTTEGLYKKIKDKDLESKIRKETNKIIEIQNPEGDFKEENIDKMKYVLDLMKKKEIYMKRQNVLNSLSLYLKNNNMLPGIVFIFSRKQVERAAKEVTVNLLEDDSKIPYLVKNECDMILRKLSNREEYLNLPEYKELISLLEKGVGIHHSGMIPVFKEIVEIMISKKYIKLLFATESFAIGLDCPIKTAIFPAVKKFDGNYLRELYAHEYTQMAGRAGRRGIDKVGYVVHCNNLFDVPIKQNYKRMLSGVPQRLISKYHISFSLILNLIKNGKKEELVKFSEKSMLKFIIENETEKYRNEIENIKKELIEKEKLKEFIKTPNEIIDEFNNLNALLEGLKNKKYKDCLRKINVLMDINKYLKKDIDLFDSIEEKQKELKEKEEVLNRIQNIFIIQTTRICDLLQAEKILTSNNELTKKGEISSMIAEINSLVYVDIMEITNNFENYKIEEIISAISSMIDIKIKDDIKSSIPKSVNDNIEYIVKEIEKSDNKYQILEMNFDINSGTIYNNLNFDLPDIIYNWLNCEDEESCKIFINEVVNEKYEIMTGEFIKALLKISAIIKEIRKMCEELGYIELLNKFQKIDERILKYVVTPQSLYL